MKLKQIPEDFRVEEIPLIQISSSKEKFRVYMLEKKNVETFSLLRYLAQRHHIPITAFGIAGLKDKHAWTKQFMTLPAQYTLKSMKHKEVTITPMGYASFPLKPGRILGNRFEITVCGVALKELEAIQQRDHWVSEFRVLSYYDSQRFGSVINNTFIAKYVMKGDYEGAVRTYLTACYPHERSGIKQEKRIINEHWNQLDKLHLRTKHLSLIIDEFRKTKNWRKAYLKIDPLSREMFFSSYQSSLWNECAKKALAQVIDKKRLIPVPYHLGWLLFVADPHAEELRGLPPTFKTISHGMKPTDFESGIINIVLKKEHIGLRDFDIQKQSGNFFKGHDRALMCKPREFKMSDPFIDELNDLGDKNIFKVIVSFILPKGSYATLITKALFYH